VNFKIKKSQIGAAFLMLIFLLGSMPKRFLHDAMTEHEHTKVNVQKCSHHHVNIGAAGFNCQLDNLVVELPFEISLEPTFLSTEEYNSSYNSSLHHQEVSTSFLSISLRGPPSC
jgi:hypothetical protein